MAEFTNVYTSMSAIAQAYVSGGEPITTLAGRDPLPAKWIEVRYSPVFGPVVITIGVERDPTRQAIPRHRGGAQLDSLPQWVRDFVDRHNPWAVSTDG